MPGRGSIPRLLPQGPCMQTQHTSTINNSPRACCSHGARPGLDSPGSTACPIHLGIASFVPLTLALPSLSHMAVPLPIFAPALLAALAPTPGTHTHGLVSHRARLQPALNPWNCSKQEQTPKAPPSGCPRSHLDSILLPRTRRTRCARGRCAKIYSGVENKPESVALPGTDRCWEQGQSTGHRPGQQPHTEKGYGNPRPATRARWQSSSSQHWDGQQ